ncbi:hypothetical protein C8R43DRAFT_599638 [Mycena crocata]|nr:hypothetical protein C8R43DRAFT_599638 [Mycena crocata]
MLSNHCARGRTRAEAPIALFCRFFCLLLFGLLGIQHGIEIVIMSASSGSLPSACARCAQVNTHRSWVCSSTCDTDLPMACCVPSILSYFTSSIYTSHPRNLAACGSSSTAPQDETPMIISSGRREVLPVGSLRPLAAFLMPTWPWGRRCTAE